MADEYADLWIAKKQNRLEEYQLAAEKMVSGESPRNAEVLANLLKAVAEELGDLPTRTQVNVATANVTYEVVGLTRRCCDEDRRRLRPDPDLAHVSRVSEAAGRRPGVSRGSRGKSVH